MATAENPQDPDREKLLRQISAMQNIARAQSAASDLKERAKKAADPKERERLFREAHDKMLEANSQSKWARRMESGTWQGMFGGGGIGAGVSAGLGTVVGTLVGGVGSLVTLPLGGLIGAGVGAIHGPWIRLPGGQAKKFVDATPEEVATALETDKAGQGDRTRSESPNTHQDGAVPAQRKKPRKIEIRSQKSTEVNDTREGWPSRPRKLKNRSMSKDTPLATEAVKEDKSERLTPGLC